MIPINKKLETILLVDDDEATNFLNERIIRMSSFANNIVKANNGIQALEFLKLKINNKHPQPEFILLDINMPAMNGWEFMEAYSQLDESQKAQIIIVMLSTSLNPDDEKRAREIKEINDFRSKPLTMKMFTELVQEFFPDRFS
ncbi:MAG: response regulator [Chitinophagaceae bacterium]